MKVCNKCKIEKSIVEFNKMPRNKDGIRNDCKICEHVYKAEYREKNRAQINTQKREHYSLNRGKILEKNAIRLAVLENKISNRKRSRDWYVKNRNRGLLARKNNYQKNKQRYKEQGVLYKKKNRDKLNKAQYIYINSCPIRKLKSKFRKITCEVFKRKGFTKKSKTGELLGITFELLKIHIERQFTKGMSWDKMGKEIHIDHVIPLGSAKTEAELRLLCHYTNIQPLWAKDNLEKRDKIPLVQMTLPI